MDKPPLMGTVQSGGQGTAVPLAGALVTLYDATEAEPKLVASATADRDGHFVMNPAPAPSAQGVYYATACMTGAPELLLAAVVGPAISGSIVLNELTTVAAAYSMAQFADGRVIRGSVFGLRIAAGMSANLASPYAGSPSLVLLNPPNANQTNALQSICSLSNLLVPTVRRQPEAWEALVRLVAPEDVQPPADTFQAILRIARHPHHRVHEIYPCIAADHGLRARAHRPARRLHAGGEGKSHRWRGRPIHVRRSRQYRLRSEWLRLGGE